MSLAEWSSGAASLVDLADVPEVVFSLDLRRAATTGNQLVAHLSFDGVEQNGGNRHLENEVSTSFIVPPADHPWSDYQIIMWQGQTPAGYATLKKLGVTAGMVQADHRDEASTSMPSLARLVDADLRCYLENISTDFYSPYHKWYDDRPVDWRFLEAKQRYWANPRDRAAFIREPSLSDPEWLNKIHDRLIRSVRALHPYRPLYYSLGDETGIGDLAAFWDFDLSDLSLAAMREWLKDDYDSLTALNQQWGTAFRRWDEVVPMTTDEAMRRSDENFSAWADFKEWMDVAFARALKSGSDAVHAADPAAVSAIEGAQIPGWGGYDYSRLATSVDAMELYAYGENIPIARSFNPELILLTTSFGEWPVGGASGVARVAPRNAGSHLVGRQERVCRRRRQPGRQGTRSCALFRRDTKRPRRLADQQPAAHGPDRHPLLAGEQAHPMAARSKSVGRGMEPPRSEHRISG